MYTAEDYLQGWIAYSIGGLFLLLLSLVPAAQYSLCRSAAYFYAQLVLSCYLPR